MPWQVAKNDVNNDVTCLTIFLLIVTYRIVSSVTIVVPHRDVQYVEELGWDAISLGSHRCCRPLPRLRHRQRCLAAHDQSWVRFGEKFEYLYLPPTIGEITKILIGIHRKFCNFFFKNQRLQTTGLARGPSRGRYHRLLLWHLHPAQHGGERSLFFDLCRLLLYFWYVRGWSNDVHVVFCSLQASWLIADLWSLIFSETPMGGDREVYLRRRLRHFFHCTGMFKKSINRYFIFWRFIQILANFRLQETISSFLKVCSLSGVECELFWCRKWGRVRSEVSQLLV